MRPLRRLTTLALLAIASTRAASQDVPARALRIVIAIEARRLWAIAGDDTLLATAAAVGSDVTLDYRGQRWTFSTPRGRRTVLAKDSLPVWVPPRWHYYEVAQRLGTAVRPLDAKRPVALSGNRLLTVRAGVVGIVDGERRFTALPVDEELVFDGVLYIPPVGTANRRVAGMLGRYRLTLGDGVSIHGTPWAESVGQAVTHGCIRLDDAALAWLYRAAPLGTPVLLY